MEEIIVLIALFLLFWFLWSGIRSKEIACDAGKLHCQQHAVQFLDHTVERRKLRLTKDSRSNPCWYRSYHFEFATNGQHRYQGKIEMYGHHLQSIKMDPYPESNPVSEDYDNLQ
jgi:hypothetical protein